MARLNIERYRKPLADIAFIMLLLSYAALVIAGILDR